MAVAAIGAAAINAARALAANPAIRSTAMEYIGKATNGRISTPEAAGKFAASGKGGLTVVAEGLVKSGLSPSRIFTDDVLAELNDADMRQLYEKLRAEFNNVYGALDAASPLKPDSGASRDLIALECLNFIRGQFGVVSDSGLKKLHANLKLFAAMDDKLLTQALRLRQAAIGGVGGIRL